MKKIRKVLEFILALLNFLFHFKPVPDETPPISLKVFLSDCFLFSAIFCFPRCFDMKMMSAARLLHLHLLQHKCVHHYKVAQASSHHEQMKNLMASKIFMLPVKNRKFQCIDQLRRLYK